MVSVIGLSLALSVGCTEAPQALPTPSCGDAAPADRRCEAWFRARTVPADRGLRWTRDADFLIPDHTVPTVVALGAGRGYRMFTSGPRRGRVAVHRSDDGLTWRPAPALPTSLLDRSCGDAILDVAPVHLSGGGLRLLTEGWTDARGQHDPSGSTPVAPDADGGIRICALDSPDGERWVRGALGDPVPAVPGLWPSVLAATWHAGSGEGRLYVVNSHPKSDAIHVGRADAGGRFTGFSEPILPPRHVDPDPVAIQGTAGVRLYHTFDALTGELGFADSVDGITFEGEGTRLSGLSGQVCHTPPEAPSPPDLCLLDPAFLALEDGRLVMYFSLFQTTADGKERRGVGRAFAVD